MNFSDSCIIDGLNSGKYGSVTKDIEALIALSNQTLSPFLEENKSEVKQALKFVSQKTTHLVREIVFVDLEDESVADEIQTTPFPVITIDSDEEDREDPQRPSLPCEDDILNQPSGETFMEDIGVSLSQACIFH